jgi:Na+/melibiose symporter-like transporter
VLLVYTNKIYEFSIGVAVIALPLSFWVVNIRDAFEMSFFLPNVFVMKKYNKHRPFLIDLPLLFIGCVILLFITPKVPLIIYFISVAFIGAGVSCLNFVPNTLMPDLTDVDELIYGKRREGTSAGLVSLGKQVVQGLSFLIFGIILSIFDLSDESKISPEKADIGSLTAMRIMLCVIPILSGGVMYFISRKYNLDAKSHDLIKAKIQEKHLSGSASITKSQQKIFSDITGIPYGEMWISK